MTLDEIREAAEAGDLGAQMMLAESIEVPSDADLAYIAENAERVQAEQEHYSIMQESCHRVSRRGQLLKVCHSNSPLAIDFTMALRDWQTNGSIQDLWYLKRFAGEIIAGADAYA